MLCEAGKYCRACEHGEGCSDSDGNPVNFLEEPCPKGHYCPTGTRRATEYPCPAGMYQPNEGATAFSDCVRCPAGSYCLEGSASHYPCVPGSYCPSEGTLDPQEYLTNAYYYNFDTSSTDGSPNECTEEFCPEGSVRGTVCGTGHYLDGRMARRYDCKMCTTGKVCPATNIIASLLTSSDYDCKAGYLCPINTENWEQKPCPYGKYQSSSSALTELSQCSDCQAGKACLMGTSTRTEY